MCLLLRSLVVLRNESGPFNAMKLGLHLGTDITKTSFVFDRLVELEVLRCNRRTKRRETGQG